MSEDTPQRGGFGYVRRGFDTILERYVAIKTLDPLMSRASNEDRDRFRREARILANLRHPNIPAVYDVEFTDQEFKIIFEWVEGTTLRELIAEGPAALRDVQAWLGQVALALHSAHQSHVIHRDIKPDNLIVTADRRHCYLVDFGIALSLADQRRVTASGGVLGTPGYMSPEQENGDDVDASSDLYSLGVTLYETLCGHRIPAGEYEELSISNEAIPPSIDALVLACIAPKHERLSSAAEFAQRLSRATAVSAPLSEVLVQGHLHEIIAALREMDSREFMAIKGGQRLLVLNKALDVLANTESRLRPAQAEFLRILPTLAVHVDAATYGEIVQAAIEWGFQRETGPWTGDKYIRQGLETACVDVRINHAVICDKLLAFWRPDVNRGRPGWFYYELRDMLVRLMANPECSEENAQRLNQMLSEVNARQREAGLAGGAESAE